MVEGPFTTVDVGGGRSADLYLLRYTEDGALASPEAQRALLGSLAGRTDVFLFSHGWNNTFDAAAASYTQFAAGYASQGGGPSSDDQPVLVGVVWPSISFTMPWEEGPIIAGGPGEHERAERMRAAAAVQLEPAAAEWLHDLLAGDRLAPDEAREAARLMIDGFLPDVAPEEGAARPTEEEVLAAWGVLDGAGAARPPDPDDFGIAGAEGPGGAGAAAGAGGAEGPAAAGLLGNLDPRNLLRMGTMWAMKDRAGKVGARGVGPLVRQILGESDARLHLIGHSFGTRLLMSALCVAPVSRPARSMLLLQPAVNRWCFAPDVLGTGRAGGYRALTERVELPVLTTMSSHDLPLRQAFHLAVRGSSLGEPNIAAFGDTDRYGALGGYGPAGLDAAAVTQQAQPPGTGYDLSGQARMIVVDGSRDLDGRPAIGGHSDINNPNTWWALRCLVHA